MFAYAQPSLAAYWTRAVRALTNLWKWKKKARDPGYDQPTVAWISMCFLLPSLRLALPKLVNPRCSAEASPTNSSERSEGRSLPGGSLRNQTQRRQAIQEQALKGLCYPLAEPLSSKG